MKFVPICLLLLTIAVGRLPAETQADTSFQLNGIVKVRAFIPANARTAESLGTEREGNGVVINAKGYILTIGYIILEAEALEVIGPDGNSMVATYVAYDHATGFGLVRTGKTKGLTPVTFGRSSELDVGAPLLLVGHGGVKAIQYASLIARDEFAGYWEYLLEDALYVAPPHPQFAGLAMLDDRGRLVGIGSIYTQIHIAQLGVVRCNMFVPIDLLKPILSDMIKNGRSDAPPKPWLGVNVTESRKRVVVERVHGDSPAHRAGVTEYDIILQVADEPVSGLADFYRKVWALGDAGVDVPLTILQGHKIREIHIQSSDRHQYLRIGPTLKAPPAIVEKSI